MFSVQELVTAVEQRLPIPIVVVDNGGYAEISAQQRPRGIEPIGRRPRAPRTCRPRPRDGRPGVAAEDPAAVAAHVRDGLTADRPTLIHLGRNR